MVTGWSSGRTGRILESFISGAISLPVLIVALIVISAVGIDKGIWAFILGLALTGWAETAHLVSEKTREVKQQAFIEAAHAQGASDARVLVTHVLRQILPMLWMFLSLEIGATLLVTAELGFLGYFIGGGVWIEVFDFQATRVTGLPELGQIIATSVKNLTRPVVLIVTGSFVFLVILGFNFLGDGLRRGLAIGRSKGNPFLERVTGWFDWHFLPTLERLLKKRTVQLGLLAFLLIGAIGSIWWTFRPRTSSVGMENRGVPGGNYWATELGNAQGTRYVPFPGPTNPTVLWQAKPANSFQGGAVAAVDGRIYVVGSQVLFAYDPLGNLIWKAPLAAQAVGTPALDANGRIFVTDRAGGLSAFNPNGTLAWNFSPRGGRLATSGPIVDRKGNIYYTRLDSIEAVKPSGEEIWNSYVSDVVLDVPPRLSPREDMLLIKTALIVAENGSSYDTSALSKTDPVTLYSDPSFFIGADDQLYFRVGHGAISCNFTNNKLVTGDLVSWDPNNPQLSYPFDAGVNGHGLLWLLYGSIYNSDQITWLDTTSTQHLYGINQIPVPFSNLIGMDMNDVTYLCGYGSGPECQAFSPGGKTPAWTVSMPEGKPNMDETAHQIWGALAPGRLYVTTRDGYLYALGDGEHNAP
jgi:hypothetical protein